MSTKRTVIVAIIAIFACSAFGQKGIVDHWEMIVPENYEWATTTPNSEPDSGWFLPGYARTEWQTLPMPLHYGLDSAQTAYFVANFTITDREAISAMLFTADYDGGFVIYLNGFEVARSNIAGSFNHPSISDTALYPSTEKQKQLLVNNLRLNYALLQGENTIAVQLHHFPQSTDFYMDMHVYLGKTSTELVYYATDNEFVAPPVFSESSNLPIIHIETEKPIDSLERTSGTMGITYTANLVRNDFDGAYNHYDGAISIKYRGRSSLEFPKKSMSIETQTTSGENNNVSLLGLPQENDWVLYAPYSDKTLIRNALTYKTFEKMGHYAPRFRFAEVIVNGYYLGAYMLTEKIKRDNNRVDISKLDAMEISGDDITGGYILSNDKGAVLGENAWRSSIDADDFGYRKTTFKLEYPDAEEIAQEQLVYIKSFCDSMERSILDIAYQNSTPTYMQYIDIGSWVDKFIITEISKDVDSYRYSQYMYKQKASKGGTLFMGPVWDYNTGYGNLNYGLNDPWEPEGWMINSNPVQIFWYDRLFQDEFFREKLSKRWEALRKNVLSTANVHATIDSLATILDEAQVRNHYQWNTLGRYVWPNNFVGDTYEQEISFLKNWIDDRLAWIDDNMPVPLYTTIDQTQKDESYAFPTMFSDIVYFHHKNGQTTPYTITITSTLGTAIAQLGPLHSSHALWQPIDLPPGRYIYSIQSEGMPATTGIIQKK